MEFDFFFFNLFVLVYEIVSFKNIDKNTFFMQMYWHACQDIMAIADWADISCKRIHSNLLKKSLFYGVKSCFTCILEIRILTCTGIHLRCSLKKKSEKIFIFIIKMIKIFNFRLIAWCSILVYGLHSLEDVVQ